MPGPQKKTQQTFADIGWEWLAILAWALYVGRSYLNFSDTVYANGTDFAANIEGFYSWPFLWRCGACVMWNGTMNGGSPTFADLFGAVLHPLVAVSVLVLGVLAGSKVVLVGSLALAGFAQWWLAKVMGLGRAARLWAAMMATAGGHLAGRMEAGHIVMVLSIATTSLILAPAVAVGKSGRRRAAIALGIAGALALVSGQGYMTAAVVFGLAPAFVVAFALGERSRVGPTWRGVMVALGLALLLAAVYWLPLAHLLPFIRKSTDPFFGGSQRVTYSLVNLIVPDLKFFYSDALGKKPIAGLYMNFIGWVPLLLALVAVRLAPRREWRTLAFLALAALLVYWTASADVLKWLTGRFGLLAGLRHPMLIAPLGVPLILGIAAWGLDLLARRDWPKLKLSLGEVGGSTSTAWFVLGPLCLYGLLQVYQFSRNWGSMPVPPALATAARAIKLDSAQWVQAYLIDFRLMPLLLERGLKVNKHPDQRTSTWLGRPVPPGKLELTTDVSASLKAGYAGRAGEFGLLNHPEVEYAAVTTTLGTRVPCRAISNGGNIDVDCDTSAAGVLEVQENNFSGWQVRRDGERAPLKDSQWLSTDAPAGKHRYAFRYRPWDVPLGLALTLVGVALATALWRRDGQVNGRAPTDRLDGDGEGHELRDLQRAEVVVADQDEELPAVG